MLRDVSLVCLYSGNMFVMKEARRVFFFPFHSGYMPFLSYHNLNFIIIFQAIISVSYDNVVLTKLIAKILEHRDIRSKSDGEKQMSLFVRL